MDFRYGCNTSWELQWPTTVSTQAISRNSHHPVMNLTYTAAGPVTDMCLYEIAAGQIARVASGGHIEYGGTSKAVKADYLTPLEPRFASEVGHAAAGLSRAEANELVARLIPRYQDQLSDPPRGQKFQECYDWDAIEPNQEYLDLYGRIKDELAGYGLRFK